MTEIVNRINIMDLVNTGKKTSSQLIEIAKIFSENIGNPIGKREIEKRYALSVAFSSLDKEKSWKLDDIIKECNWLPGDVQRQLRTFHDNFSKYGLERTGKSKDIVYTWNPITMDEYKKITEIQNVHRNIFKSDTEYNNFCQSRCHKCEICGSNERLAVDHWRAHSVYKIDNQGIAVLLCEKCNNIHHNFDASKIITSYKDNTLFIKNWINIEKRVRDAGFPPNKSDLDTQNINIQKVNAHHKTLVGEPYPSTFWRGLDKVPLIIKK